MNENWHRHLGVYGICFNPKKTGLLLIKKAKGPYEGLFDLPGGGIKKNERLEEALKREMLEETGIQVKNYKCLGVYDFLINTQYMDTFFTHHIACLYHIDECIDENYAHLISETLLDGEVYEKNDASGFEFVEFKDICIENASPLVLKAIEIYDGDTIK